jgi:predicted NBD/HSP70 family sugar kinase
MGALGESRYGAGREVADLLYLKLGTGIGGGVIMGGQLYRGHSGSAGEIGHMTVEPNGPRCNCGNRGCLEALAGAPAIVEDARQGRSLRRRLERDGQGAPDGLGQHSRPDLIEIGEVVQAALDGDPACKAALEQAGEHIGTALASLINFFNPSLFVLDGKTMCAGELLLAPIRRTIAERSLPAPLAHTQIIAGKLGGQAIPLGGIATVIDAAFGASSSLGRSAAKLEAL